MTAVTFSRSFPVSGEAASVWKLLIDLESYPAHMSSVQSVSLSHTDGHQVSRWRISARGHLLDWTAYDRLDHAHRRYSFQLIEGDFDVLDGVWSVVKEKDGCRLHFDMTFDIGIPVLANTLNPVLEEVLSENINEIAASIASRSSKLNQYKHEI